MAVLQKKLRTMPLPSNTAAAGQFIALMLQAVALEENIRLAEATTNALVYQAFGLHPDEIIMIEADRGPVFGGF